MRREEGGSEGAGSERAQRVSAGAPMALASVAALGVVFGDIGTSPLYALKACFAPEYGLKPTPASVSGVLSLIVWSLTLVVSIKYVVFIMQADNRGEGGILALLALLRQERGKLAVRRALPVLVVLGLFGAALLYGDGVITPAISVLSAVEGIGVATRALRHVVVPIAVVLLFGLFVVQHAGTGRVGGIFGPIMVVWFSVIGVLGAVEIAREPGILAALNPWSGVRFFLAHGARSLLVLGAVVLAVTGAEALYADMGHFGTRPIRLAWFAIVFPALLLNYFGQGALLLRMPAAVENPFFLLAPRALLYPLVVLATAATIIASQALISGAYSLTQQAIQLDYSPLMRVVHTSHGAVGQIYVPTVNTALMIACLALVVGFRSSDHLAAAYGIAVTGTMAITTLLFYALTRSRWGWSRARAGAVAAVFLTADLAFFATNVVKVAQGGWVPLAIGAGVFVLMNTWETGRCALLAMRRHATEPLQAVLQGLSAHRVPRVGGTAVFLTGHPRGAPGVLLRHLKHNKALHEHVVLLSIRMLEVPTVADGDRVHVQGLPAGFVRVIGHFGFMEHPQVEPLLARVGEAGTWLGMGDTTYYVPRERLLPTGPVDMVRWRKRLFILMARNAHASADFFGLPPGQVVELGTQVEF